MAGAFPGCDLLIAKTFANDAGYYRDMADGIVWATDNGGGAGRVAGGPESLRAQDPEPHGKHEYYGHGRINAKRTVKQ